MYGYFGGAERDIGLRFVQSHAEPRRSSSGSRRCSVRISDATVASVDIVHIMFPEWRVTPFFTLGTGSIHTVPKATLVATIDRTDPLAHVGFGVRTYTHAAIHLPGRVQDLRRVHEPRTTTRKYANGKQVCPSSSSAGRRRSRA